MTEKLNQSVDQNYSEELTKEDFLKTIFGHHIQEVSEGVPVVLFGAGMMGTLLCDTLKINGVTPTCFCDNDAAKCGTSHRHTPVITFGELKESYRNGLIVLASKTYSKEFERQLLNNGFQSDRIVYLGTDRVKQAYRPFVTIRTVQKCNSGCIMCFHRSLKPINDLIMPMEEFEHILDKVLPNTDQISFTDYGEFLCDPFVYRRFDLLRDRMEEYQTFHQITNGSLLTQKNIKKCFAALKNVSLAISLDTTNEDLYRKIRQNGHFKQVIENIRQLRSSLDAVGVVNLTLCLSMVMMKSNIETLPGLIRFASEVGSGVYVDHLDMSFAPESLNVESLFHHQELCNKVVNECKSLANKLDVDFNHPPMFGCGDEEVMYCDQISGTGHICILPGGDVNPCCISPLSIGNALTDSYSDIVSGSKVKNLRHAVEKGRLPDPCVGCRLLYSRNNYLSNPEFYGMQKWLSDSDSKRPGIKQEN